MGRLICFAHAGGGASAFRPWAAHVPPGIELCPVQLPGRESRFGEPCEDNLDALVLKLLEVLPEKTNLPYVLFGHSLGARIIYELGLRLESLRGPLPLKLVVSGAAAPHLDNDEQFHTLPEAEFIQKLKELDGCPRELFELPEILELLLPVIRADFRLAETSRRTQAPAVAIPITALGGTADGEVPPSKLNAWASCTSGEFEVRFFPGGHFYFQSQLAEVCGAVLRPFASAGLLPVR